MSAQNSNGPLEGLVVVDLTRALSGPYATMLFADLGATVIKVESLTGDPSRVMAPFRADDQERYFGGYFQSVNRNKQDIAVDFRTETGRTVLRDLLDSADVVIENFRPGVMDEMGLGYESLAERNPALVYGAVRGFGDPRTGETAHTFRPAFDVVAQAMGGLMHMTGHPDGPPTKVGPGVGDIFPGVMLCFGVMAAVYEAQRTGRGRFVDVAMYDAMISLCERIVHQQSYVGAIPGREGNDHPILSPFGVFEAADGFVAIAAPLDAQWCTLCQLFGEPELAEHPDFATNAARSVHRDRVRAKIEGWLSTRTRDEVVELIGTRVPIGPVNTVRDIVEDPHVLQREMLIELEQPGSATPVRVAGQPIKFTGPTRAQNTRAPLMGEHTHVILQNVGYTPERIEQLAADGHVIITDPAPLIPTPTV